jgi:dihydropteroate synthase
VSADEELRRVLPVLEGLCAYRVSIDTTKAAVARAAVAAGASIVNDVSGGLFDPAMIDAVRELGVTYIAGHLRGRNLAEVFSAEGTVSWETVSDELHGRIAGLGDVWVDPGLGFGKGGDPRGNRELLLHAGDIAARTGRPVVIGASRKRFVRRLAALADGATRDEVDAASIALTMDAVRAGAHVVRVHNVALLHTALSAYNKK